MVARRNTKGGARRPTEGPSLAPPVPGAEWGDEEEFERFWGTSIDKLVEEFRREDAASSPRRTRTEAEFLASLEDCP